MGTNKQQSEMETEISFRTTFQSAIKTLKENNALCEEQNIQNTEAAVFRICWDTRLLPSNENVLFLARKGVHFDGHSLAEEFLQRGFAVVGERCAIMRHMREQGRNEETIQTLMANPKLLCVHDSENALKILLNSALEFHPHNLSSIAITGTSGKTSTTQITAFLWNKLSNAAVLRLGTLGIQMGESLWDGSFPTMPDYPGFLTALTAAHRNNIHQCVFEATSHGLVGKRLGDWEVDIAIFTNLSQDHLDFHKTMASYRSCKGILFEKHLAPNGTAIVNTDDPEWTYFANRLRHSAQKLIGFGSPKQRVTFFESVKESPREPHFLEISDTISDHKGIRGAWRLFGANSLVEEVDFECPLLGAFQHHNLAASVAAMLCKGFSLKQISLHCSLVPGIPGRLEHVVEASVAPHPVVLVDYAHKPDALEKTLQTLKNITPPGAQLISVFGCGGDRDTSKRPIMGEISSRIADISIVTSDNPRTENANTIVNEVMAGIPQNSRARPIVDRREAIFEALREAKANDVVVISGKGHEDYQIIGTQKYPFSDFDIARCALKAIFQKQKKE